MLDPRLQSWPECRFSSLVSGDVFWKREEGFCIVTKTMGGSLKSFNLRDGQERSPMDNTIVRKRPSHYQPITEVL